MIARLARMLVLRRREGGGNRGCLCDIENTVHVLEWRAEGMVGTGNRVIEGTY